MGSAVENVLLIVAAGATIGILIIPSWRKQVEAIFGPQETLQEYNERVKPGVQKTIDKILAQSKEPDTANCKHVAGNTIWESSGCYGGKRYSKLAHNAGLGKSCALARDQFVAKYRCGASQVISYLSDYTDAHNPTEGRVSIS